MNEDESLKQALAPFRREPEPVAISAEARARIVASMRAEARALPRARRRNRMMRTAAAGAALAACATFAVWRFEVRPSAPGVVASGLLAWTDDERNQHVLHGEQRIVGDAAFSVPAGAQAALTTTAGVRMRLAEKTRMRVHDKADRVELDRGSVSCEVPKLGPTRSFEVHAGSARVIVHGTAFQVSLEEARTPCVRVREGLVEVQNAGTAVMLRSGESWGCQAPAVPIVAAPAVLESEPPCVQTERAPPSRVRARHHRRGEIADPPRESTLGLENALLSSALHAERSNDAMRARALFEELLRRFPDSPLAPEARAGMQRNAP